MKTKSPKKKLRVILDTNSDPEIIREWVNKRFTFPIQKKTRGNPKRKKENRRDYFDCFAAFDIETTNLRSEQQAFMYLWSFQLDKYTLLGRTWEQFRMLLDELSLYMQEKKYLIIWVHNLQFEWNWLKSVLPFTTDDVFALDNRKVVKCTTLSHFEFRCSYILTQNSLSQLCKNMGVKHYKLDGSRFDYSKIRTPGKALKSYELRYSEYDVRGLVEALKVFFKAVDRNFYNIPLTNTGFIRNDLKDAIRHNIRYSYMVWIQPDLPLLNLMHWGFRGGDTHTNRYYSGRIIEGEGSSDRESAYPAEMLGKKFPGHFTHYGPISLEDYIYRVNRNKMAAMLHISLRNVKLKDPYSPDPYISFFKCRNVVGEVLDNGRIISAASLEMAVTDIDLRILWHEYSFDIKIIDSYFSSYKPLPECVKDVIRKYGKLKTELKGVEGEELNYQVAKGRFNSIYGCCVMYPLKPKLLYQGGEFIEDTSVSDEELLKAYSKKGFLPYQWGVWVTAWARYELRRGMYIVGNENMLYCDTDSVKYVERPGSNPDFRSYNEEWKQRMIDNDSVFYDKKGNPHYLGQFEKEKSNQKFRAWGAKKYCVENEGVCELTLAGVKKKAGSRELEEAGGIEAFKVGEYDLSGFYHEGMVFRHSAGLKATYNDDSDYHITLNGEDIHIISNLYLEETEYTLGITNDYETIIQLVNDIWYDKLDRNKLLTR